MVSSKQNSGQIGNIEDAKTGEVTMFHWRRDASGNIAIFKTKRPAKFPVSFRAVSSPVQITPYKYAVIWDELIDGLYILVRIAPKHWSAINLNGRELLAPMHKREELRAHLSDLIKKGALQAFLEA